MAGAAGLALAGGHALTDGGFPSFERLPLALAASLLIASIEACAALCCYWALGGFLGLRTTRAG